MPRKTKRKTKSSSSRKSPKKLKFRCKYANDPKHGVSRSYRNRLVFLGAYEMTSPNGLRKKDIMRNRWGKYVSKSRYKAAIKSNAARNLASPFRKSK
jgi:hypothetical protein